jgi:hypothetical protein
VKISIDAQIEEVERELRLRGGVYARQVASGKMRKAVADMHTDRMVAVLETLRWLRDNRVQVIQEVVASCR